MGRIGLSVVAANIVMCRILGFLDLPFFGAKGKLIIICRGWTRSGYSSHLYILIHLRPSREIFDLMIDAGVTLVCNWVVASTTQRSSLAQYCTEVGEKAEG